MPLISIIKDYFKSFIFLGMVVALSNSYASSLREDPLLASSSAPAGRSFLEKRGEEAFYIFDVRQGNSH